MLETTFRTDYPLDAVDFAEAPAVEQLYERAADSKPLRIALLSYRSAPYTGGQGVYVKHLSKALCDLGHRVHVLSGQPYPHLDDRVGLIKLPSLDLHAEENAVTALRWNHFRDPLELYEWYAHVSGMFPEPYTFGQRALQYLKDHRGDFDIVHDNQSLSWPLTKLSSIGLPFTATIHHPITMDRKIDLMSESHIGIKLLIRRWYSFLEMQRKVSRRLDHIITVSERTRRDVAAQFKVDLSRMSVIHNGVDTELFKPKSNIARAAKRLITTASADVPLKGLNFLIEAYAKLLTVHPDLELIVIGKLREGQTSKLLDKLELRDRVQFVSEITDEEITNEYARATIAVCPSVYEGFGFPAAEAMSCGVPLVSTDGGALPEVVGNAGVIVPAQDPAALAEAIDQLLQNPERRLTLGLKGRARMVETFSWQHAAEQYVSHYRQVIAHAHR